MTGKSPELIDAITAALKGAGTPLSMSAIIEHVQRGPLSGVSAMTVHASVRHLMALNDVRMLQYPGHAISYELTLAADEPWHGLSRREREVAVMIVEGLERKVMAERLGVDEKTIDTHRARVLQKLACGNAVQLTHLALAKGWVSIGVRGGAR